MAMAEKGKLLDQDRINIILTKLVSASLDNDELVFVEAGLRLLEHEFNIRLSQVPPTIYLADPLPIA